MTTQEELIETIFRMSRSVKERLAFHADFKQLSVLQIHTLNFLKQRGNASMSEIAQEFTIELPSATSLITTLAKLDLVTRKPDEHDRRLVRIVLSKKGVRLLQQAMAEREKKIKVLLSTLTTNEQQQFLKIIKKFNAKLEEGHEK